MKAPTQTAKAKAALHLTFGKATDAQGYVNLPQENLIAGVRLDQFEKDLRRGDGDELQAKLRAVHSSSALAVNCFAPFKDRKEDIHLLGRHGAVGIEFEWPLRIFRGGTPANLDVWVDQGNRAVAIESKLLEYFEPKKPKFSPAYERLAPPISDSHWWAAYTDAKQGAVQHLDRAQLLKHYFGLNQLQRRRQSQQPPAPPQDLVLLYLFWEPVNAPDLAICHQHRTEIQELARQVSDSAVKFRWISYPKLWQEWIAIPALAEHAENLKRRYEVGL